MNSNNVARIARPVFLLAVVLLGLVLFERPSPADAGFTLWPLAGNGTAGFNGHVHTDPNNARLNTPTGLAFSKEGDVYIADTFNHIIRRIDHETGELSTVAGTGEEGFDGHEPRDAKLSRLASPSGVAVASNGDLYIADTGNNIIRRVDENDMISTVAGTTERGFDRKDAAATNSKLNSPWGIALGLDQDLYIADKMNHAIRHVNLKTGIISTLVGTGEPGGWSPFRSDRASEATLREPRALAFSPAGYLYIADTKNNAVRSLNLKTRLISSIGNENTFDEPAALALSNSGLLVVADRSSKIKLIDSPECRPTFTRFDSPSGISGLAAHGDTFVASNYRANRVLIKAPHDSLEEELLRFTNVAKSSVFSGSRESFTAARNSLGAIAEKPMVGSWKLMRSVLAEKKEGDFYLSRLPGELLDQLIHYAAFNDAHRVMRSRAARAKLISEMETTAQDALALLEHKHLMVRPKLRAKGPSLLDRLPSEVFAEIYELLPTSQRSFLEGRTATENANRVLRSLTALRELESKQPTDLRSMFFAYAEAKSISPPKRAERIWDSISSAGLYASDMWR